MNQYYFKSKKNLKTHNFYRLKQPWLHVCVYMKYNCKETWVYAGRFVLWVIKMQVCVWECVDQHVSCVQRACQPKQRVKREIREEWSLHSSVYIYQVVDAAYPHKEHAAKEEMDTHAHLKCYSIIWFY